MRFLAAVAIATVATIAFAGQAPANAVGRAHIFPVRGPHGVRGPIGEFGAPRSGGRIHEGFDVLASCGTELVAARVGKVVRRGHDSALYGFYVLIHGRGERRNYLYAHLAGPDPRSPRPDRAHGAADRSGGTDRQRPHRRLHAPFRAPGGRPPHRPRAGAPPLGPLQLTTERLELDFDSGGQRRRGWLYRPANIEGQRPQGELLAFDCEHFTIYLGEWFERVVAAETAFLQRVLSSPPVGSAASEPPPAGTAQPAP
jgi:hypothetical protein